MVGRSRPTRRRPGAPSSPPVAPGGHADAADAEPRLVPDPGTKYRKWSTLVLDILDSRKKLIWRGSRTSTTGTNPEELARGIDHAVARLLEKFPPRNGANAR